MLQKLRIKERANNTLDWNRLYNKEAPVLLTNFYGNTFMIFLEQNVKLSHLASLISYRYHVQAGNQKQEHFTALKTHRKYATFYKQSSILDRIYLSKA
jgi:hypothetical protein